MGMHCVSCEVGTEYITLQKAVSWLRLLITGLSALRPGSIPVYFVWDLWWTTWYRGRLFSEYFCFPLSVALHHCSLPIFVLLYCYKKENGRNLGTFKVIPSIIRESCRERYFHTVNVAKFLRSLDLSEDAY